MIDINDYIKLSRETRISHIDLSSECVIEHDYHYTRKLQTVLSNFLNTTIPMANSKPRILVCHLCYNSKCCNPLHLYWGTDAENIVIDASLNTPFTNVWENRVRKHGYEKACSMNSTSSEKARLGGLANKGIPKSDEHKKKIAESIKRRHAEKQNKI